MFQPISHQRSCLLLAEAGPENHLFYLSRRSKLERHQPGWEEEKKSTAKQHLASWFAVINSTMIRVLM